MQAGNFEINMTLLKIFVESDLNTYQYATLHLKYKNIDLAIFFLEGVGSFSLMSKHLRNNKKNWNDGS